MKRTSFDTMAEAEYNLSDEEYTELVKKLEDFQESILSHLAGTANYEIIPLTDRKGTPYSEEQISIMRKDCLKKGATILYATEYPNLIRITNSKTFKTVIIQYNGEIH